MAQNERLDLLLMHRAHILAVQDAGLPMFRVRVVKRDDPTGSEGFVITSLCKADCLKCQAFWDMCREAGFAMQYQVRKRPR